MANRLNYSRYVFLTIFVVALLAGTATAEPLPSWNDGPAKTAIIDFLKRVTTEGSPDFVPTNERIATFDNDGTLWCEQPDYVEVVFAIDRLKSLAPEHPQWQRQEPFATILKDKGRETLTLKDYVELVVATHAGMSSEEFEHLVTNWFATARHPRFHRPYTSCIYQPMLEVLALFREHGFKTFIVSGGGAEFMRPWTEKSYGIPRDQVVGSSIKTEFKLRDDRPALLRLPTIDFIDDGPGKPVGIGKSIGRRPIAAFGNSDADIEMLEWATVADGVRFGLLVHHTDSEREYAYDRKSHVGRLDRGLDEAPRRGWTVVDMRRDWKVIFPD